MKTYDKLFYLNGSRIAFSSAEQIVPLIMQLLSPQSVVDIGCGTGEWLSVFEAYGVKDILGVDGHWVPKDALHIPKKFFIEHDIVNQPFSLCRQFGLALSLEVGEHLPADTADRYIADLTALAPVVLFSAAIPDQGGVNHINEQWPVYWTDLFNSKGFVCIDCIRMQIWNNPKVAHWYAQNCFIAVKEHSLPGLPILSAAYRRFGNNVPAIVHPSAYHLKVRQIHQMMNR